MGGLGYDVYTEEILSTPDRCEDLPVGRARIDQSRLLRGVIAHRTTRQPLADIATGLQGYCSRRFTLAAEKTLPWAAVHDGPGRLANA